MRGCEACGATEWVCVCGAVVSDKEGLAGDGRPSTDELLGVWADTPDLRERIGALLGPCPCVDGRPGDCDHADKLDAIMALINERGE